MVIIHKIDVPKVNENGTRTWALAEETWRKQIIQTTGVSRIEKRRTETKQNRAGKERNENKNNRPIEHGFGWSSSAKKQGMHPYPKKAEKMWQQCSFYMRLNLFRSHCAGDELAPMSVFFQHHICPGRPKVYFHSSICRYPDWNNEGLLSIEFRKKAFSPRNQSGRGLEWE